MQGKILFKWIFFNISQKRVSRLFEFVRQSTNQQIDKIEKEPLTLQQEKEKIAKLLAKRQSKDNLILCRICEELIDSKNYEEHSKTCAIRLKVDAKCIECDDTLKKVIHGIKKKNKDSFGSIGSMNSKDTAIMKDLEDVLSTAFDIPFANKSIPEFDNLLKKIQDMKKEILNHVSKLKLCQWFMLKFFVF